MALSPRERELLEKLFGNPMDLPHEFRYWLQGYLQINQPRLSVSNLVGSQVPIGTVVSFAGTTAPSGWLLCDGSAVSRESYADLFELVGITYGAGDGSTTFNLPNLEGRVPVGFDSGQTEFDALGETGGTKTHTLTEAEMPSHDHGGFTGEDTPDHTHGVNQATNTTATGGATRVTGPGSAQSTGGADNTHVHPIDPDGGGGAHQNLQPYIVLNYIIKA